MVIEGVSLNPWTHSSTVALLVMKRERKGLWSFWRHKSPCTHQSSAFPKPENCLWPLTSPGLGIAGMCLDLVLYRKCVSSLQLLAWCTANFFFFSQMKRMSRCISDTWNFWYQSLEKKCYRIHGTCHLMWVMARSLQPRTCSKIQHLWKWKLSSFILEVLS